jgi:RNA polymerase sigma-70 factor (ECF subfamily)
VTKGNQAVPVKHVDELRAVEQARLELIRRVAAGDQDALGSLYDSTNRSVFGLVLRVLNDPAASEEVTLEVYTQVWRQAANYDPRRGTPSAWLLTIARSRAIDRFRSTDQTRRRQEPLSTVETARSDGANPEENAAEAERREIVRGALDTLPPEQREVIELAYFSGLSHSEIAERCSLPLGTVKTRTRLAMVRLRAALASLEGGKAE